MQKVEVRDWQGGSSQDLVSFLHRKSNLPIQEGRINGGAYIIECQPNHVPVLVKLNGIRFAGKALRIRALETNSAGSSNPQTLEIKSILQGFLQSRYDPQAKLLNLVNIRADPTLGAQGFFNTESNYMKMVKALIKVAQQPFVPVVSVSLEQNELKDISAIDELHVAFPDLVNLSLANNFIATAAALNPWKKRFMHLTELVLNGNPISDNQTEMKKLIDFFPRLTRLNGVVVRSEQDIPKLPMPIQQNFFESPDIQSMAQGFLTEFIKFWDSDRSQLLPLYDDLSEFSYVWDGFAPHTKSHPSSQGPRWLQQSRNLARATAANMTKFLTDKIAIGRNGIGQLFQRLPKTKTGLSDTEEFSFEAWQVQNVRQTPDTAVLISIHGVFSETGPRAQRFSFDRYLLVLPGQTGSMLIASDMMIVRYPGTAEIFKSNSVDASAPAAAPNNAGAQAQPIASPGQNVQNGAASDPEALVQQLMQQTGLNRQYATQCLQQANLDLALALSLFQQHRGQLPPEAFI